MSNVNVGKEQTKDELGPAYQTGIVGGNQTIWEFVQKSLKTLCHFSSKLDFLPQFQLFFF